MATPAKPFDEDDVLDVYLRVLEAAEEREVGLFFFPESPNDIWEERHAILTEDAESGPRAALAEALRKLDGPRAVVMRKRRFALVSSAEKNEIRFRIMDDANTTRGIQRLQVALRELGGAQRLLEEAALVREEASKPLAHRMKAPWPERALADAARRCLVDLETTLHHHDQFRGEPSVRNQKEWDELLTSIAVVLKDDFTAREIAGWLLGSEDIEAKNAIEQRIRRFKKATRDDA